MKAPVHTVRREMNPAQGAHLLPKDANPCVPTPRASIAGIGVRSLHRYGRTQSRDVHLAHFSVGRGLVGLIGFLDHVRDRAELDVGVVRDVALRSINTRQGKRARGTENTCTRKGKRVTC